jgi:hypothetical protein
LPTGSKLSIARIVQSPDRSPTLTKNRKYFLIKRKVRLQRALRELGTNIVKVPEGFETAPAKTFFKSLSTISRTM